jgi:hypothetical protein
MGGDAEGDDGGDDDRAGDDAGGDEGDHDIGEEGHEGGMDMGGDEGEDDAYRRQRRAEGGQAMPASSAQPGGSMISRQMAAVGISGSRPAAPAMAAPAATGGSGMYRAPPPAAEQRGVSPRGYASRGQSRTDGAATGGVQMPTSSRPF